MSEMFLKNTGSTTEMNNVLDIILDVSHTLILTALILTIKIILQIIL